MQLRTFIPLSFPVCQSVFVFVAELGGRLAAHHRGRVSPDPRRDELRHGPRPPIRASRIMVYANRHGRVRWLGFGDALVDLQPLVPGGMAL
jgi:hypothetical protein